MSPPSVRLESFTRGGLGPANSINNIEKAKNLTLTRRCWKVAADSCRHCQTGRRTADDDALFYQDNFNDQSWSCSVGTTDEHGIWLNRSDPAGTIMSFLVWVLIGYSGLTMAFLAETGGIPVSLAMLYCVLASFSLASHVKTTLSDPGSVPASAVPTEIQRMSNHKLSMCSQCQTFKPPGSHHCRICNRCISRMDHHCPWMNNCVGAGNMKHFLLFLIYTWSSSVCCLSLMGYNYFFCSNDECMFNLVLTQLVRIMTVLSVGAFLFTSSMLMNVCYGLMTGIGTIDRLKKKATNTMVDSDEEPIPLQEVFGIGPYYTWPLPTDPVFEDYDQVMGFSTPQRLLREQMRDGYDAGSVVSRDSFGMPV
jgi:hypothetical protein